MEILKILAVGAPIATALIALVAAVIAFRALKAQQGIAQSRTTIDFFLKIELNVYAIELHHKFRKAASQMKELVSKPDLQETTDDRDLSAFLDFADLIAVAIKHKAISNDIARAFWGDVLPVWVKDARPLIDFVRGSRSEGTQATYAKLIALAKRWDSPHSSGAS